MESSSLSLSSSSTRKAKATSCVSVPVAAHPHCLVDGCDADLSLCRDYHRRHKVCEMHSKTPKVTIGGREQRFCQQCSRFHSLVEFDEGKRSCRKRLDGHNRRRRKPQPMDSSLLSGRNSGGPIFSTSSQHSIASGGGGAGFISFATSTTSYPLPQILPSAAAVSSSWGAALKFPQNNNDTNTGLINQSHHQFNNNFTERQSNSPFHQVEFMQQNNTTEAAATSSSVFSSDEGLHHHNCNHQVVDDSSDRALSLLSSAPRSQVGVVTATTTMDFGFNHNNVVVQPVVQQSLEINNHNLQQCYCNLSAGVQYHACTHDGETKPPIVDSAGDSTLHFPGMFHYEPDEASSHATGESPHQTLKFIWE